VVAVVTLLRWLLFVIAFRRMQHDLALAVWEHPGQLVGQFVRDVLAPPQRRRVAADLKDRSAPPGANGAFRSALENEPGNRHGRKDQSNRDVGIDGKSHDRLRLLEAFPAGAARTTSSLGCSQRVSPVRV